MLRDNGNDILFDCVVYDDLVSFTSNYNTGQDNILANFRLMHQNIRSYNKNFDQFLVLLQSLKIKFHCIVLSECWLRDDSDLMNVTGYNIFRSYNNLNQNDGIVVYIDNALSVSCSEVCVGGVATGLSLTFDWAGVPCDLLAVYRSPSSLLPPFFQGISGYINNSNKSKRALGIIAGDLNIDFINVTQNSLEESFFDDLHEAGFVSLIDKVTRSASNTCLDLIFVKPIKGINIQPAVLHTSVTDHFLIFVQLSVGKIHSSNPYNNNNFFSKIDFPAVKNLLENQNWIEVLSADCVDVATETFTNVLKSIIEKSSTLVKKSAANRKLKPWITLGLVTSIRKRDKLSKQLQKEPFNWQLRNKYFQYRNLLHALIKRIKYNYFKNKLNDAAGDPKKFWTVINEVAGRSPGKEGFPIEAFAGGGGLVTQSDTVDLANNFNKYFASVGSQLAEAIKTSGPPLLMDADHRTDTVFEMQAVSQQQILDVVKSLRGGSAPGWDDISSNIIKNNIQYILIPLHYIINLSISKGKFPKLFKIAKVIPIFKSGSRSLMSNFRPISLLVVVSKILEKCVKIQLANYLEGEGLISFKQYGFRKNKNTSDSLYDFTELIATKLGCNNRVLVTFLDLAKAFDSVDRQKMFQKLQDLGIQNKNLEWFKSYFYKRFQTVCINGIQSDPITVDYGVVQGSTLGPLLFLAYFNNVTKLNLEGDLFLFADDTALVSSGCSWDSAYEQASSDLLCIKNWMDHNTLTVNVAKTKTLPIFFRTNSDPGQKMLKMHSCGDPRAAACDCDNIERVEQYKYLGVIIDYKLSWVPHVQYVKKRLRKMIYAFAQLRQVLSLDQCRTVYFSYVQSILQYGILAWGGASSAVLEPLAVTQRAIIKTILNKGKRYSTQTLYNDFPVHTVRKIYLKTLLTYIYKNKNKILSPIDHLYLTRNRLNYGFAIPKFNHSIYQTSSFYIAHTLYRNIPDIVIRAESGSADVFKRVVGQWLSGLDGPAVEALLRTQYQ